MNSLRVRILAFTLFFPLCACSYEDSLWPTESAAPAGGADAAAAAPTAMATPAATTPVTPTISAASMPPPLGSSTFEPPGVTAGSSTGTFVGQKVVELREELRQLQASVSAHNQELQGIRRQIVEDSQRYHGAVATINTRLQVGTTPGNPILVQQFNGARADLDRLASDIGDLNKLATGVTGDSTMSTFIAESTRASFQISGAVDEDHRQLAILQDEVEQTSVLIDRLLSELSEDIRRQTEYVATERGNLNLLASGIRSGEVYGSSLLNQAIFSSASAGGSSGAGFGNVPPSGADLRGRRPLVVIRFDRASVPYEQAVYNAVSKVLERRPDATFDLVAVSPSRGGAARVALESGKARRNAENVMRSLVDMGLPPSRVAMAASTSDNATSNEVHLYIR